MAAKKTIFIADVHLRGINDPRQDLLVAFLSQEMPTLSHLVIVGDLFDYWYGYRTVVYWEYLPILNCLLRLREAGIKITYFVGNHDFRLGAFFSEYLRCDIYLKPSFIEIEGKRVFITHGDEINKRYDWGYAVLYALLRNRMVQGVLSLIPPDWGWKLAMHGATASRNFTKDKPKPSKETLLSYLKDKIDEGADVVIAAHSHQPLILSEGDYTLFNLGDFIKNFVYLKHQDGQFVLRQVNKELLSQYCPGLVETLVSLSELDLIDR